MQKAKPRRFHIAQRGLEGVATRMIGRDAEFEALQDAFGRLFSERQFTKLPHHREIVTLWERKSA